MFIYKVFTPKGVYTTYTNGNPLEEWPSAYAVETVGKLPI